MLYLEAAGLGYLSLPCSPQTRGVFTTSTVNGPRQETGEAKGTEQAWLTSISAPTLLKLGPVNSDAPVTSVPAHPYSWICEHLVGDVFTSPGRRVKHHPWAPKDAGYSLHPSSSPLLEFCPQKEAGLSEPQSCRNCPTPAFLYPLSLVPTTWLLASTSVTSDTSPGSLCALYAEGAALKQFPFWGVSVRKASQLEPLCVSF